MFLQLEQKSLLDYNDDFRSGCQNVSQYTTNSPSQDYTHPDDHTSLTYDMTPRFKPFTDMNDHLKAIDLLLR